MKPKRFLAFFFVIIVAVSPVSSCYAWSWDYWQNLVASPLQSINQSVDSDIVKKLLPMAIIAGLIFFLRHMQKKANATMMDAQEKAQQTLASINFQQIPVYNQFYVGGGGGASCGYHTLLRAMQLVKSKSNNEGERELRDTLAVADVIDFYFGSKGEWRLKIIEKRTADVFKNKLHQKLLAAFKIRHGKEVELYKSSLGLLEEDMRIIANSPQLVNLDYDVSDDAFYSYISKGLGELRNEENASLVDFLSQSETIQDYFDLDKMRRGILAQRNLLQLNVFVKKAVASSERQADFNGEWLKDSEVEYLWNYETDKKNSIIPKDVQCNFKAIPTFQFIGTEGFDEVTPYIDEKVKPLLDQEKQLFHVFALGTMRQGGDQDGTDGHWYPLVMHQKNSAERNYYIMDSMGSHGIDDPNARTVINLIEQ